MKENKIETSLTTIRTKRFLLRRITNEDINHIYQGLSHPEVIRYYGISFDSLEATKEQMDWFVKQEESGAGIWWAICSPDMLTFYGAGGLNDILPDHRKGEVGFWLLPEYWGKGIMQETMPEILKYGFEQLNLHRIEGFVENENLNCKKALEKLQFRYEGTMKECEFKDGRFISLDIYAVFK